MGAVFNAVWWISKALAVLLVTLLGLLLFIFLAAAVPALTFLGLAISSDWTEVQAIRFADPKAKPQEDSESLIPGGAHGSSVQLEQLKSTSSTGGNSRSGAETANSKLSGEEKSSGALKVGTEAAEAAPLKPTQSGDWDQDEFTSPRVQGSKASFGTYGRRVVVIIPAANEEASLPATLDRLNALHPPLSLIVVADGGSTDGTARVAEEKGAIVVSCSDKIDARQMNVAAREAAKRMREEDDKEGAAGMLEPVAGDSIFCFLRAGTIVPLDLVTILQNKFAEPSTCCTGFVPLIAVPGQVLWLFSVIHTSRTWLSAFVQKPQSFFKGLRLLYGDQALSCCSRDFFQVGGFDEGLPILEDADLCERLHSEMSSKVHAAKVCLIPRLIVTRGQRYVDLGLWKAALNSLHFAVACLRKTPPEELQALHVKLFREVR